MQNPVFINKEDAKEKGIENGDVIRVFNDNGSFIRPASVTPTVMSGVIMIPHGATVRIDDESGIDMAGADNMLTSSCKETSSGLDGWNTTLVDYEKYTGSIKLDPDCEWATDHSVGRLTKGAHKNGSDGFLLRCGKLHWMPYMPNSV